MAHDREVSAERGNSNYSIGLVGMERLHPSNAGVVNFQISAQDGQQEFVLATLPITVDGGQPGLDATAARACELMGDALHKMLETIDGLRDHYSKK